MGPLIPNEIIPAEWNNVLAVFIGFAFGYILEASGFSSSRKIAGVFYGYDFAVLKVFFTTTVVAVIGLYYMDYLNLVDIAALYVHPTYLWAALIGGTFMGLGMVVGGYCPGTCLAGSAIGKIDAMLFAFGVMIGVFIFSEAYPLIEGVFNGANLGNVTISDTFGWSAYWVIFVFTIIAIAAFVVADMVRKRVKKVFY